MKTTGEIIKMLRESRGLTQQQMANVMGMKTYTTISKWESGDNFPKGKDIKFLSEYFKVSSDFILGLEENTNIFSITEYPFYPIGISAGLPLCIDSIDEDNLEYISIPDNLMGKWAGRDIFMMRVNGDSMNKVITHGSLIAIKPVPLSDLKNGDIVVYSDGGDYAVKRFHQRENKIIFRPDSTDDMFSDYETTTDNSDLKIHGKVVMYLVELD